MKELPLAKYFKTKIKFQKDLKKRICPVLDKYYSFATLQEKNNYLDRYSQCDKLVELINYTKQNIDWKLINITEENKQEYFSKMKYSFDCIDILDNKPDYTVGVFLIPRGNSIPLHNHPNMFVISKIIWGNVLINNYDKVPSLKRHEAYDCFPVEKKEEKELKLNELAVLTPSQNNIHEVCALEDSALFDIILPAYDGKEDRDCDYFELLNIIETNNENKNKLFLRKI